MQSQYDGLVAEQCTLKTFQLKAWAYTYVQAKVACVLAYLCGHIGMCNVRGMILLCWCLAGCLPTKLEPVCWGAALSIVNSMPDDLERANGCSPVSSQFWQKSFKPTCIISCLFMCACYVHMHSTIGRESLHDVSVLLLCKSSCKS